MTIEPSLEQRDNADAGWIARGPGGTMARCSLWWNRVAADPGERLGYIGHYEASDDSAGAALLERACQELRARGCTLAVGPIDGSTWRSYRLVIDRGSEPPFFLEPDNPDNWPAHFLSAKFTLHTTYSSAIAEEIVAEDPRIARVAERLRKQSFTIRPVRLDQFERELLAIFRISLRAFAPNYLYTPILKSEFLSQYQAIAPRVVPDLVLIAEHDATPIGFVFAIPDLLQAARGVPVDTFIVKTLAVDPAYSGRGLGSVLLDEVNRHAVRLGFRRSIHALMHDTNESTRISARQARVFRRYGLFARSLYRPS